VFNQQDAAPVENPEAQAATPTAEATA